MRQGGWFCIVFVFFVFLTAGCGKPDMGTIPVNIESPAIFPDYRGVLIPPDIAPLNFSISDSCEKCYVLISGKNFRFEKLFRGKNVIIPAKTWRKLLAGNKGGSIAIETASRINGTWRKQDPFNIFITGDPVDNYLVYRLLMPGFQNWNRMGIYQRTLSDFKVRTVLDSKIMPGTCMNCHSFSQNNPDNMVLHLRESYGGTILFTGGSLEKLATKTGKMFASAAFPSWHPSGNYIAFSVNRVNQIFHAAGPFRATALDLKSDIVVYDIKKREMKMPPQLAAENKFETFPCFSSDGKTLYFCSADERRLPAELKNTRYSLCSVAFDEMTGEFGSRIDTLISSNALQKSISIPRASPDGKYLMFTVSDFGAFPSYNPEADLWIMDLQTGQYHPADSINSSNVESWHTWSSNSRWVAFSSRRTDGLYSNVWLAYLDREGNFHKPFLLPQKDPGFYKTFLYSFNVPEFAVKEIGISSYAIEKVAKRRHSLQVQSESSSH